MTLTDEALAALRARLARAVALTALVKDELNRLRGKAQGVGLALSYLDEAIRAARPAEPSALGSQVRGRLGEGVGAIFIKTTHSEQSWLSLRTGRRGRWDELNDVEILNPTEWLDSSFLDPDVLGQI